MPAFSNLKKQFVIIYLYIFHNHLNAEPGVAIEACPQGTGMQNAHFSMVFWSKVLEDNSFRQLHFFPRNLIIPFCHYKSIKLLGLELLIDYSPPPPLNMGDITDHTHLSFVIIYD